MRAHIAHADAAEVEGRLRGGAARLHGVRVSSSGLPAPQWNSADVTAPDADLAAAGEFFGDLPWGLRVPEGIAWSAGRHIVRQSLMTADAAALRSAAEVSGLIVRAAGPDDIDAVLAVDGEAFESDSEESRPWVAPHLDADGIVTALGLLDGEPVATAYAIRSDGDAGPALLLAGVAVLGAARRRGIGAYVSWWLLRGGFDAGAAFAHLHADTPAAARVYAGLGFADAGALDIFSAP